MEKSEVIRVNNIKITPCERFCFKDNKKISHEVLKEIKRLLIKKTRIPEEQVLDFKIVKQSIDARKKDDVKVVFSIDVKIKDENAFIKKNRDKDIVYIDNVVGQGKDEKKYIDNKEIKRNCLLSDDKKRIIVVGAGPAGLMCALRLAEVGANPILLERGEDVDSRMKTVGDFWQGKPLNPSSNVQFGEGGAGTFSDGKLNTMVKDKEGYMKQVYQIFVENGADESILYINKPHIGTDKLTEIVKSIRKRIIELGGEVRFSFQVTDIKLSRLGNNNKSNNITNIDNICNAINNDILSVGTKHSLQKYKVTAVALSDGTEIECDSLVLALGHSARDTFEMLAEKGVYMEQKPFAIGVRVQHPRDFIDRQQYGDFAKYLPAADYKLTYTREGKRSVYSFCMCPGGYVVNASSEEGRLAVNGMSYSDRNSSSSNSAVVVQVGPEDYPGDDPLAGMRLQRKLEENAYKENKGKIPVQRLEEFVKAVYIKITNNIESKGSSVNRDNQINNVCTLENYFEDNEPDCKGLWEYGDLTEFLPQYIIYSLLEAFPEFGKSIKGYNSKNTLLLGLESRTSSPVRICRGENLQSVNIAGLYPCGEGAGYAGGITSAAMDGLKVADRIIEINQRDGSLIEKTV
ncbi:MAG: NAD(P)/FAD-dependent oxidoreductase [Lachnospiraceae bacterium]|nr:NAD(P)/FAD-dependent oxidoreductase [Lachnospiraceae bacterium]